MSFKKRKKNDGGTALASEMNFLRYSEVTQADMDTDTDPVIVFVHVGCAPGRFCFAIIALLGGPRPNYNNTLASVLRAKQVQKYSVYFALVTLENLIEWQLDQRGYALR